MLIRAGTAAKFILHTFRSYVQPSTFYVPTVRNGPRRSSANHDQGCLTAVINGRQPGTAIVLFGKLLCPSQLYFES